MKWTNALVYIFFLFISLNLACAQNRPSYEIIETSDISYLVENEIQDENLQKFNLVIPKGVDNPPLFIWIGGGAWAFVNRHQEMNFARKMAKEGFAVASLGHRLSPGVWRDPSLTTGVKHPTHISDVAQAFKWLYEKADSYGYNPDQIFIGGFSSGAHLSTLLSMDTRYLEKLGLSQDHIKGVIPVGGGYDIVAYREVFVNGPNPAMAVQHVDAVFGDTKDAHIDASPTSYLDNLKVPMLIFSEDMTYNYTKIFEDAMRGTDFRDFEVVHVHTLDHAGLWRNISNEKNSRYRNMMVDFMRKIINSSSNKG